MALCNAQIRSQVLYWNLPNAFRLLFDEVFITFVCRITLQLKNASFEFKAKRVKTNFITDYLCLLNTTGKKSCQGAIKNPALRSSTGLFFKSKAALTLLNQSAAANLLFKQCLVNFSVEFNCFYSSGKCHFTHDLG